MGLVLPKNILRSPRPHEGLHHMADPGIVGPGGELAVGEGPGPSLAKLHVGLWIQVAALPEGRHVLHPLFQGLAPLQQDGPQARPGQAQGRQQSRRAAAHHHRGQGGSPGHLGEPIGNRFRLKANVLVSCPANHLFLIGQGDVHRHHIVDAVLFPGIDGLAHGYAPVDFSHRNTQSLGRPFF